MASATRRNHHRAIAGFTCRLRSEWMIAETLEFNASLNRHFIASDGATAFTEVEAVFGPSAYRLDAAIATKPDASISVIQRRTGEVLWLDHAHRRFTKSDGKRLPPKRVSTSMRMLSTPTIAQNRDREEILERRTDVSLDDPAVIVTELRDSITRCDWKHYVICDAALRVTSEVLHNYLSVLCGDPELQTQAGFPWKELLHAITSAGLPVAGGMLSTAGSIAPRGSAFRMEHFRSHQPGSEHFAPPADYRPISTSRSRKRRKKRDDGGLDNGRDNGRDPPTKITSSGSSGSAAVPRNPGSTGTTPVGMAPVIGLFIPQSALDAIRQTVNQAAVPFSGFAVSGGALVIDWLERLRSNWFATRGVGGTMLYCALHDETLPAAGAPLGPMCASFTGKGLLDVEAMKSAQTLVSTGALPASVVAALPAAVASDLSAAGTNWFALKPTSRLRIACEVMQQVLGVTKIMLIPTPPDNVPPGDPPSPAGTWVMETPLAKLTFGNITGGIVLPAVEKSGMAPVISSRPLIKTLACRGDVSIQAEFDLESIALGITLDVEPTLEFWAGVAAANLASVLLPFLAALSTHAATVALELLASPLRIHTACDQPTISCRIRFDQNAQGVFGPVINSVVTGNLSIWPDAVEVLSLVGVLELFNVAAQGFYAEHVFPEIKKAVTSTVERLLQRIFGQGFPAAISDLGIPIVGGYSEGADMQNLYFEVRLGIVPGAQLNSSASYPAGVNSYVEISNDVSAFLANNGPASLFRNKEGLHCLSLCFSENALADILAQRLLSSLPAADPPFSGTISNFQTLTMLANLAKGAVSKSTFAWVSLDVVAPPRVKLASAPGTSYATLDVDLRLMALAVNPISAGLPPIPGATWEFHVSSSTSVVLGSALPANGVVTQVVDLTQYPEHIIDQLIDLNQCTIVLQSLLVVPEGGGPPVNVAITPNVSSEQEPLLRAALALICAPYGLQREPRRDGIGAPAMGQRTDGSLEQTYTFDGSDPDAGGSAPVIEFPVALGLSARLFFMHVQLAGLVSSLLDGTINISAADSDCAFGRKLWPPPRHRPVPPPHF